LRDHFVYAVREIVDRVADFDGQVFETFFDSDRGLLE
jgi:hypothetical protein